MMHILVGGLTTLPVSLPSGAISPATLPYSWYTRGTFYL
jgi:hypothetical protein